MLNSNKIKTQEFTTINITINKKFDLKNLDCESYTFFGFALDRNMWKEIGCFDDAAIVFEHNNKKNSIPLKMIDAINNYKVQNGELYVDYLFIKFPYDFFYKKPMMKMSDDQNIMISINSMTTRNPFYTDPITLYFDLLCYNNNDYTSDLIDNNYLEIGKMQQIYNLLNEKKIIYIHKSMQNINGFFIVSNGTENTQIDHIEIYKKKNDTVNKLCYLDYCVLANKFEDFGTNQRVIYLKIDKLLKTDEDYDEFIIRINKNDDLASEQNFLIYPIYNNLL
jgi:hypothetical protein